MPSKGPLVCLKCETSESPIWTNAESLGSICLDCVNEAKDNMKSELENEEEDNKIGKSKPRNTRSYRTRLNPFAVPKVSAPKTRGRRGLTKKTPVKAPTDVATTVTSEYVFYKGSYIQVGDIVSVKDVEGDVYYAQIRGLLTDQFCNKSAVLTWLLPTQESPPPNERFDAATYIIGPEEDVARRLDCMEFIMHAPSDYYKANNTPYPSPFPSAERGYIWTSINSMSI
ncbi:GATA zinc finger domain-containing protein 1 [Diabrotica virgifera virgifera]|uniref:GATA zinc finger domain-containing protein 1 n=1 Tax=Diabrotica virgifera virgifera TaxID=50390 RepID=A0ABM5KM13_DIAVI|nr:GATA zinc finger domain-containing protein 1 [Diabrotica virgifera virgifera]